MTLFASVDALVTTGRSGVAPPVNQPLDGGNPVPGGFNGIVQAGNLAGLPAIAFPCGFVGNLPVALQVVGPAFPKTPSSPSPAISRAAPIGTSAARRNDDWGAAPRLTNRN